MTETPLAFRRITELAAEMRRGALGPVALAEQLLDRIAAMNPRLHAFLAVTRDRALAEARAVEKDLASGKKRGPLQGIPYGVKDLVAAKGAPTTWGAAMFEDRTIDEDATVVPASARRVPSSSRSSR